MGRQFGGTHQKVRIKQKQKKTQHYVAEIKQSLQGKK